MITFDGQVAVVPGGAGGIGSAICAVLREGGATVVSADIADGADIKLDITDSAAVNAAVAKIAEDHGRIDILVNVAGFPVDKVIEQMTDEDWRIVLDVSLFGTFAMCRAVIPVMKRQKYGRIVNISSRAYLGNPGQANYAAAKAGVNGLTKALAKEIGRDGITVNAIAPGLVATPMVRAHPKFEQIAERAGRDSSLKRAGEPEEIAAAVAFLASKEASFITGDILHLTGGRFG